MKTNLSLRTLIAAIILYIYYTSTLNTPTEYKKKRTEYDPLFTCIVYVDECEDLSNCSRL